MKLEWIARNGEKDSNLKRGGYFASVLGLEHTLFQSIGDNGDIGFLIEYNFDSRRSTSSDLLQDDIFMAMRFVLNDAQNTEMLLGSIFDLDGDGQIYQLDFGRRLNDSLNLGIKGAVYQNGRIGSNLYILRQDSWLEVSFASSSFVVWPQYKVARLHVCSPHSSMPFFSTFSVVSPVIILLPSIRPII